jgi:hypothetical protein
MDEDRDKDNGGTISSYNQLLKHHDDAQDQLNLPERCELNPEPRIKRKEI